MQCGWGSFLSYSFTRNTHSLQVSGQSQRGVDSGAPRMKSRGPNTKSEGFKIQAGGFRSSQEILRINQEIPYFSKKVS